jgi:hypothetical protein
LDAWLILIGNNILWQTHDGGRSWIEAAPASVERQFPQQFSSGDGTVFVKTQNALWRGTGSAWQLLEGSPQPY